jgi:hypothetical protein
MLILDYISVSDSFCICFFIQNYFSSHIYQFYSFSISLTIFLFLHFIIPYFLPLSPLTLTVDSNFPSSREDPSSMDKGDYAVISKNQNSTLPYITSLKFRIDSFLMNAIMFTLL